MRVYKFGGASIASPERMAALLPIVSGEQQPLLIVISALGKTTNALESIVKAACSGDMAHAMELKRKLEKEHLQYAHDLLSPAIYTDAETALMPLFTEFDKAILAANARQFDKSYDQIVSMGELFSSTIMHYMLVQNGVSSEWVDVRRVILTDDTYRDASVHWNHTRLEAQAIIGRTLKQRDVVVTQGFIGATEKGASVTLGREGSDYTAAILAAMLGAESVTIWKDVDGFRNADPKLFEDTVKIEAISFAEVIEMAFYGAQIIHPKTIKPLHNYHIPLYVKCFLDKSLEGTVIKEDVSDAHYPPLIVLKENQVLVQVTTRDFSFITEDNLSKIYSIFHDLKVKINLIQNAAISFIACIDNREEKIVALRKALSEQYKVSLNDNVSILTVRHFNTEIIDKLTKGRKSLLKQETRKTMQVVMQ